MYLSSTLLKVTLPEDIISVISKIEFRKVFLNFSLVLFIYFCTSDLRVHSLPSLPLLISIGPNRLICAPSHELLNTFFFLPVLLFFRLGDEDCRRFHVDIAELLYSTKS